MSGEAGGDPETLAGIEEYNKDDVLSTWKLRDWLEGLRAELAAQLDGPLPRPPSQADKDGEFVDAQRSEAEIVGALLTEGLPDGSGRWAPEHHARWLLAQLLGWHRRENKASWWRYFALRDHYTDEQRVAEKEPIGMLELVGRVEGAERTYRYRLPAPGAHRAGRSVGP